jgi:hypothetical protein
MCKIAHMLQLFIKRVQIKRVVFLKLPLLLIVCRFGNESKILIEVIGWALSHIKCAEFHE